MTTPVIRSNSNPTFEIEDRSSQRAGVPQSEPPQRPAAARTAAAAAAGMPRARAERAAGDQSGRAAGSTQRAAATRLALMRQEAHQVGMAVVNSSPVQGLVSAAVSVGNTLLPPTARTALANAHLLVVAPSSGAAQMRTELQDALKTMGELPDDAPAVERKDAQTKAHHALITYSRSTGPVLDRWLPVVHKGGLVGAGAGSAFGGGRSSGIALADTALRHGRNQERAGGIYAPEAPSGARAAPGTDALVNAATQLVMGSAMGGVGNFIGERALAPLVNLIGRQSAPVDPKAVVTDEMVALMNELKPGAGTQLREAVVAEQKRTSSPGSDRNVAVGQFFFDGANAARAAAQGSNTVGTAGAALIGTAVSSLAGASIGTTMAINASLTKMSVPDMASLRLEHANQSIDGRLENVVKHDVSLFFTKHTAGGAPVFSSPVSDPSGSMLATVANTGTSIAQRGAAMFKATTGTALVGAMTPALVASMPNEELKTAVRATAAGIGIHMAIQPWFTSLASGIPSGDKKIVESRKSAVEAAQARAQPSAQQTAQAAAGVVPQDIEMGLVQRTPSRTHSEP